MEYWEKLLIEILFISDLLQCTNEPNVSIPQLADLLIERTQHQNWVIVYKSLISIHNLMNYGNEVSQITNSSIHQWFDTRANC